MFFTHVCVHVQSVVIRPWWLEYSNRLATTPLSEGGGSAAPPPPHTHTITTSALSSACRSDHTHTTACLSCCIELSVLDTNSSEKRQIESHWLLQSVTHGLLTTIGKCLSTHLICFALFEVRILWLWGHRLNVGLIVFISGCKINFLHW